MMRYKVCPTQEEQKEMDELFKKSTIDEKAKINYIYIHLNELQLQLCRQPQKDYEQFSYDFIETLCTRDFSRIESEGAEFARKILARFVKKKHFSLK